MKEYMDNTLVCVISVSVVYIGWLIFDTIKRGKNG